MAPLPAKVRVLIATTEGPVEIESLWREPAEIEKSFVVLSQDLLSPWRPLSGPYSEFASRNTGFIGRLFGHDTFRLAISGPIHDGRSWQLGVLIAHALEAAGRLAKHADAADIVVLATGELRWPELQVNKVGYVEDKLTRTFDRLKQEKAAGRRVIALWPKDNHDDAAPRIEGLQKIGVEVLDVEAVASACVALDLPAPVMERVRAGSTEAPTWRGSPFRGLEVFTAEHRAVFFGRGQAREEAFDRLRRAAGQDCAFLLIYGASGSGKSSLVRAGLVGDIKESASEAEAWRDAVITTGQAETSPVATLANSLLAAVPELGRDADALAGLMREKAADVAAEVTKALGESGVRRHERLILVVDQLEGLSLWAREQRTAAAAAELDCFAAMLDALARSGAAWVVATLRSDLLPLLAKSPPLLRLATDERRYSLNEPSRAELREIVRRPAEMAGLGLEGKDGSGLPLADVLVEAAVANPGSLPLLQFVLARLYDAEGRTGQISYEAYTRIGGIEGAIGRWADKTVEGLGEGTEMARAVDDVLLALARTDRDDGTVVARTARLDPDWRRWRTPR